MVYSQSSALRLRWDPDRVLSHLAGETWRSDVFKNNGDIYCASASQMFGVPVEKHGVNGHLRQKGKIAELALGYGGSVGALKAMGALEMGLSEEELQPLVSMWRESNPRIVQYWWKVDTAVKKAIKEHVTAEVGDVKFFWKSGMLFIELPSRRRLAYVKPKIGVNQFGGESVTSIWEPTPRKNGAGSRVTVPSSPRTSSRLSAATFWPMP